MSDIGIEHAESQRYGYRCHEFAIGQCNAFVIVPESPNGRWVWYAPTITNAHPHDVHAWLFERILKRGMAIVGIDVGESYGNECGRAMFSRFYSYLVKQYQLRSKATLLAQSRGLMLYNWAAENPQCVDRIAGIYTVCDLRSYPGIAVQRPRTR